MKVGARCGYCLLHRGYRQILRSTDDEAVRKEAIGALLHLMADMYGDEAVPSIIGAERDRLVHRVTECPDPYAELKKQANQAALEILPSFEALVATQPDGERLRKAALIACLGNIIEYDVPGHSADVDGVLDNIGDEVFTIDDLDPFEELLGPGVNLLYLTDNAGEVAFDRLVVRELGRLGCRVTVAVKGGPSLNDALMEDAEAVGMVGEADLVITTGTDAVGVNLSEVSREFLEAYRSADVILSKGMANWETLTEYEAPCPTLFLFRAKCEPVADAVGVPLRENVAKLVPRGWIL
ncbi:DUF89 family protein [Candidatus Bathyarchaeota archaeon]|nr:DUF89 family protein [Candidatus Bathyarchaeota archaeon]